jgi:hypothetical protein
MVDPPDGDPALQRRRFANNQAGYTMFTHEETKWEKYRDSKLKIISKLLMCMDKDVRTRVENQAGFNEAFERADLLAVLKLFAWAAGAGQ